MTNVNVYEKITFSVTVDLGDTPASGIPVTLFDKSSNSSLGQTTTDSSGVAQFDVGFGTAGTNVVYASVGSPANIDSNDLTINVENVIDLYFETTPANGQAVNTGGKITLSATYEENGYHKSGVLMSFYADLVSLHESSVHIRGRPSVGELYIPTQSDTGLIGTAQTNGSGVATIDTYVLIMGRPDFYGDAGSATFYATANGQISSRSKLTVNYSGDFSAVLTEST